MALLIRKYCSVNKNGVRINGNAVLRNTDNLIYGKFIRSAYKHFGMDYPKFFKMDSLSKLGFISAEILLQSEALSDEFPSERSGLILFNASSSLEIDEKHQQSISNRDQYFPSPSNFVYTLPNIMAGEAAIRHSLKGENTVLISDGFEAKLLYDVSEMAFAQGALQCCICGWVEQYGENYESVLFLIEHDKNKISGEDIIFEPSNLIKLYKQEQEWKN